MLKNYDLSDFVSFKKDAKRGYQLHCNATQETNIYRWFKDQGFGVSESGDKVFTFRRVGEEIQPVSVITMKRNFLSFLETANFSGSEFIGRHDLVNWFYSIPPLKHNESFRNLLKDDTLSPDELYHICSS